MSFPNDVTCITSLRYTRQGEGITYCPNERNTVQGFQFIT